MKQELQEVVEAAWVAFADEQGLDAVPSDDVDAISREGFYAGFAAGSAPKWVPVETRMPEGGKWYLVTIRARSKDFDVVRDFYAHGQWSFCGGLHDILAWCERPDPYVPTTETRTVTIDHKSFEIPIVCTGGQLLATAIAQGIITNHRYQLQGRNRNGTNAVIGERDVIPEYYETFDVEFIHDNA